MFLPCGLVMHPKLPKSLQDHFKPALLKMGNWVKIVARQVAIELPHGIEIA